LKYKQLFNDDLTGNFVISLDGTIELCNPAMAKIFGCDSVDELMKSNISEFYRNTEDRGKLLDLIREKKKVERYEQEHITRDGRVIILIKNVIGEFDENGVLIRLKGSMFDNTERKRAEKELQEKEIRYRTLFNVSPSGVVLADLDGIIIDVNESFCKSVSYARDELIEKNIRILVPPQNLPGVEENIKEILSGNIVEHIVKNVKKDGTLCDMELRESLVILPDGRKGILSTANDITERKRAEQILQKLNMAIRNSNEVVFMTDKEGIITYINPEFTKMYGYTAEEVIGKTTPRILKSGLLTSEQSEYLWKTLLNKQSISTAPYTNKCKDGSLIDIEGSADSIIDENGEIIGFLAIQRDITQRKLAEKELIEAKEKAEQSNKLKDAFIANMSHEIRTPLNGILGLSSLIKDTYAELINEEDEELFVGIDQSSQRIIRTIDMILNYSRIQTGEFPISPDQIEISLICENLVKEFTTAAKSKCLELSFENRCGKTITIFSDEYSVTNAISNLIDNAIKYTNEGAIDVILYSGKNDEILLDIKDSGIGIGEEYLQHIFEPYQQEQMGYGRAYEGIGLGLSMVKNFLNLNNATISIDSKKEKGTTFTINFGKSLQPLAEKITEVKIDRTFAKQEKQSKPLVLIVEDDAINQMTIIRFISDSYNTISTDSSEGAIELLKNNKVDMILMDISIKGSKNGLELTKELKASKEYLHIPIIGVTAHAFESDRNNALEAGCDDYLSKPFSKNLLLDTMGKFV
ncbi:MAG: PAS domain S-box protein, partial [Ignavibacteriaceae bacterium]|nr:PAS domain S-box protein [Ignavibacteriaceae bacterium]